MGRQRRREALAVGDAQRIGGEVAGRRRRLGADRAAEALELPVVADRDDDMAVGDGEHLIGRDVGMGVAEPASASLPETR